ncbi:unnamed protein product [Medioppia subpectinata]|uniref:Uncharacterized protein n=1 Tax=Medioppia subpectinata TaxID=1979941 RepID=A0A7R9PVH6_9ACAR|nr:unnamed protein product [Medioppia subpectinata]CAG2102308.1 unnamed protein product [Medioppia subpectinata]
MLSAIICLYDVNHKNNNKINSFTILITLVGFGWLVWLHVDIIRYKRWALNYLNEMNNKHNNNESQDYLDEKFYDTTSIATAVVFNTLHNTAPQQPNDQGAGFKGHSLRKRGLTEYDFQDGDNSSNFYLKCGMTVFCFGSIVHMGVQLFSYIYFYAKGILINRYQRLSRFALMHLLATSLSVWFRTIINEAIDDYVGDIHAANGTYNETLGVFNQVIKHQLYCLERTVINAKSMATLPYLYPFTIEFNIIMASIWYICWTNIANLAHSQSYTDDHSTSRQTSTSLLIRADCHASNRGLFCGLSALLATAVTIIIFFATQSYEKLGLSVYSAQISALTAVGCSVVPLAYNKTRRLDVRQPISGDDPGYVTMHDLLLLIPIPFFITHYITLIMASVDKGTAAEWFLVVIYLFAIAQVLCQSPFIVDGMRRCANTRQLRYRKPGREWIIFALILNVTLWILNTFELKFMDRYEAWSNCNDAHEEFAHNFVADLEWFGQGDRVPESETALNVWCAKKGLFTDANSPNSKNLKGIFPWIGSKKPKATVILGQAVNPSVLNRLTSFCRLNKTTTKLTYAKLFNEKIEETKNLKLSAINAISNLPQADMKTDNVGKGLCIMKSYVDKLVDLYPDQDGFKQFVREHQSVFASLSEFITGKLPGTGTGQKAADKCDFPIENGQGAKQPLIQVAAPVAQQVNNLVQSVGSVVAPVLAQAAPPVTEAPVPVCPIKVKSLAVTMTDYYNCEVVTEEKVNKFMMENEIIGSGQLMADNSTGLINYCKERRSFTDMGGANAKKLNDVYAWFDTKKNNEY